MLYRNSGAWGSGIGRRLTSLEADSNTWEIEQRLADLEAAVAAGTNPVANITSTGGAMYITMASGTIFGPLYYPAARWNDAGKWSAGSTYYVNDLVTIDGAGIYHVLQNHVADNNFDADRVIGEDRVYNLMVAVPNPAPVINVDADTVILSAIHANCYVRCRNLTGTLVYIEAGTFDPPTEIHFRQAGAGAISFAYGDSGTFINPPAGGDLGTDSQGAVVCLKCVGANEFDLFGAVRDASG